MHHLSTTFWAVLMCSPLFVIFTQRTVDEAEHVRPTQIDRKTALQFSTVGSAWLRHQSPISHVSFLTSSKVKSMCFNGQVIIWDLPKKRIISKAHVIPSNLSDLCFSLDAKIFAGVGNDSLLIGNCGEKNSVVRFNGQFDHIIRVASDSKGYIAAFGGVGGSVFVWDFKKKEKKELLKLNKAITALKFLPDGKSLAVAAVTNALHIIDIRNGTVKQMLPNKGGWITSLDISATGKYIACGTRNGKIRLWELGTAKQVASLGGREMFVSCVRFSADGKYLAWHNASGKVFLWNTDTRTLERELPSFAHSVTTIDFSPNKKLVAFGGLEHAIRVFEISSGKEVYGSDSHFSPVRAIALSQDGESLISGSEDNRLGVWNCRTGRKVATLSGHEFGVSCLALCPHTSILASGSVDNNVHLWNLKSRTQVRSLAHDHEVLALDFAPDGKTLASSSFYGTIILWNVASGTQKVKLQHSDITSPEKAASSLCFSRDGGRLGCGLSNGRICVWDITNATKTMDFKGHKTSIRCFHYLPGGRAFMTVGADGLIQCWNAEYKERVWLLQGVKGPTAVSSDGSLVVQADEKNGSLWAWEVATGKLALHVKATGQGATSLCLNLTGDVLVSGTTDTRLFVWMFKSLVKERQYLVRAIEKGQTDELWRHICSDNAQVAYATMWLLQKRPKLAFSNVRQNFKPNDREKTKKLVEANIRQLNSASFAEREKAHRALSKIADMAEPILRKTYQLDLSIEVKQRIGKILQGLETSLTKYPVPKKCLPGLRTIYMMQLLRKEKQAKNMLTSFMQTLGTYREREKARRILNSPLFGQPHGAQ